MKLTKKQETWMMLAWAMALIATLGSLFYSEFMGYVPCQLCWIQRIFMYPLVVIYGTALLRRQIDIALPGLILSGIGLCISIYHYGLQKLPFMQSAGNMCTDVPCNLQYVNYFGFITIPFLAGSAFIVIFLSHLFILRQK
ncbi:MAG TPA: disulfide oxidoreductase [Pseudogracilibacillus sp.]|nr:disulfide oxidoreductase [Pseudogracilibacillus sp.]